MDKAVVGFVLLVIVCGAGAAAYGLYWIRDHVTVVRKETK